MRRIAYSAKSRSNSQQVPLFYSRVALLRAAFTKRKTTTKHSLFRAIVGCALLALLLANVSWADEPAAEQQAVDLPKSGVIIRLQLQPSTPEPEKKVPPEPATKAEADKNTGADKNSVPETNTESESAKIPASAVQYRTNSKGNNSQQSSRVPSGPLQRRFAQRRAETDAAVPSKAASQPKSTRQPASTKPTPSKAPAKLATPDRSPSPLPSAGAEALSSLSDRTVLELSANPKPPAEPSSLSPSAASPSAEALSTEFPSQEPSLLELTPRQEAEYETQSLDLEPALEPTVSSLESMDADEGLTLDAPRSLTLSRAGGANEDKALDSDFSNERPLDSLADESELQLEPDDVPLEHEPHPFDAPTAESIAPIIKRSTLEAEPFTERERRIQAGIARCLNYYITHPENTTRRGPWALMHAALPYGAEGEVLAGNRRVNTIGWLSFNGTSGKQHMFQPTRTGFRPNVGPGMQGHEGQFLAILAQSDVRSDYPLQVNGRRYTVMDLARYEMATCREKSELTFKLIGLSRYLEPNQQWRDNRGRPWTVEKMLAEEMAQPINGAACGGVHRLMGLSFAIVERQAGGQPLNGNWQRAETYLNNYVQYTMTLQNPDGSFSTNWFESRGMNPNIERRVQTSGHILEWLVYTLPDDHLRSPQIEQAIEFLLNTVGREPDRDWPIGPRGHALRAMALYSQRVFGARSGQLKSYLAEVSQAASIR